jgi:hypothetical protein
MISGDFDASLDEALSQLTKGTSSEPLTRRVPEMEDLLQVARRLPVLAPAPMPNLAKGRQEFLREAARLSAQPAGTRRWPWGASPRRVLVLAGSTVLVLIVGVMMTLAASSLLAGIPGAPALWFSSTPTTQPTYTATPTQISLAPVDSSLFRSGWVSEIQSRSLVPSPNPAPQAGPSSQNLK